MAKRKFNDGGGSCHDRDTGPARSPKPKVTQTLLLTYLVDILETPRDRLGRLDFPQGVDPKHRKAQEKVRELAVAFQVGGCTDTMEQCAKVIRRILQR